MTPEPADLWLAHDPADGTDPDVIWVFSAQPELRKWAGTRPEWGTRNPGPIGAFALTPAKCQERYDGNYPAHGRCLHIRRSWTAVECLGTEEPAK